MKRMLKRLLLLGFVCFLLGAGGLLYYFSKYGMLQINMVTFDEQHVLDAKGLTSVEMETETADIAFTVGNLEQISVRLVGEINENRGKDLQFQPVLTENGTLQIRVDEPEHIGFSFGPSGSLQLQVIVPQKVYDQVRIKTITGDVHASMLEANICKLQSVTGDMELEGFKGKELTVKTQTGDLTGREIEAQVDIETQTGDAELQLAKLSQNVSVGSQTGELLISLKNPPDAAQFDLRSDTGEIKAELPNLHVEQQDEQRLKGFIGNGGSIV
jgi:lia operon protein LiaG